MTKLEFFYDFSCPYAYLASTQIRALAARAGAELIYKPFLLGGVFRALGDAAPNLSRMVPARARLNLLDMHRWAEHWNVPFAMPPGHPNRTVLALRAALASNDLGRASHALFSAYWHKALDLSDPSVVSHALDEAGFDGAALVAAADDAAIKQELFERTDEAIRRDVFGAPTCFVNCERLWGQDRLDFVARALGVEPEPPAVRRESAVDTFEFWFDFSSPFAYLAATQVPELAAASGARAIYQPFLLGGLFRAIGTPNVPLSSFAPQKQSFMRQDMERFARHYGVAFRFPSRFPIKTVLPLRVALLAGPKLPELARAIFDALWVHDRDISDPAVLREICRTQACEELVERASSEEVKQRLHEQTARAVELGICGAPSFQVGPHLFWGQDRLPFVELALAGWRPRAG